MVDLMEKHVVSLELSKDLKKAGWKKETQFYWIKFRFIRGIYVKGFEKTRGWRLTDNPSGEYRDKVEEVLSAPISTEILEELPFEINKQLLFIRQEWNPEIRNTYGFTVSYDGSYSQYDKSLPDALAKLWLWLKKEGKI